MCTSLNDMSLSFKGVKEWRADAQSYFPEYVDRSLRLTAYWADCQLRMGEGIAAARTVWEDALKTSTGRYAGKQQRYLRLLFAHCKLSEIIRLVSVGPRKMLEIL